MCKKGGTSTIHRLGSSIWSSRNLLRLCSGALSDPPMNTLPSHHPPRKPAEHNATLSRISCCKETSPLNPTSRPALSSKTARFPSLPHKQHSQCPKQHPTCLTASLRPPPCSRRSLGADRRMGRGVAQHNSPLSPSSAPCPSLFSAEGAPCPPCPGPTGSVTLCQGTARSVLRHNEPLHINSTWWNKKKIK